MEDMIYHSPFGDEKIHLAFDRYMLGDAVFLQLLSVENGYAEPYASLTVNLPDPPAPEGCGYLDINNLPNAEAFVEQYDLGVFTGVTAKSGFCEYPLYRFDLDRIKGIIEEQKLGFEKPKEETRKHTDEHDEPLTDTEQRIFLAAMGRETKVCKELDKEMSDDGTIPLSPVCASIERKVKNALFKEASIDNNENLKEETKMGNYSVKADLMLKNDESSVIASGPVIVNNAFKVWAEVRENSNTHEPFVSFPSRPTGNEERPFDDVFYIADKDLRAHVESTLINQVNELKQRAEIEPTVLSVSVTPLKSSDSSLRAICNANVDGVGIKGIRIFEGKEGGLNIRMPQIQGKDGIKCTPLSRQIFQKIKLDFEVCRLPTTPVDSFP